MSQERVTGYTSAPALRRSPRDHAAGLVCSEGKSSTPAAREIGARKSRASVCSRSVHIHAIFEGRRGERLRAGAYSRPSVTLRAPAAGPSPAGGDERGTWNKRALALLRLRRAIQRRPRFDFGGLAGACRRGRRPDAAAACLPTVTVPARDLHYRISRDSLVTKRRGRAPPLRVPTVPRVTNGAGARSGGIR